MASQQTTQWDPASILISRTEPYALLVLNQPLRDVNVLRSVWHNASVSIAADGGANRIYEAADKDATFSALLKKRPLQFICGDLDSVSSSVLDRAKESGTTVIKDEDQYSTDFTKCFKFVRKNCSPRMDIVCMGGLSGRVDQGLATLNHLFVFQQESLPDNGKVYLLSTEAITFVLSHSTHVIKVKDSTAVLGTNIGIIPKSPCNITTTGLQWDVQDWRTEWGGQISTSNYVREEYVTITTDGDVLFTIDYALPLIPN